MESKLNLGFHDWNKITAAKDVTSDILQVEAPTGWELQLPFAAKELMISPNPADYLIYPVPIMYSDLPNRNGFAFPLEELIRWNVELGRPAYKGWAGMPMYEEHRSEDHKKALGMVIDTSLTKIVGYGMDKYWKVVALAAIDKTKNKALAERMQAGELATYSMGALVEYTSCSFCGAKSGECTHVPESNEEVCFYVKDGRLVYKNVHYVKPYELSVVVDPAFGTAQHTVRLDLEKGTVPAF
jgi:hypothetical protein